MKLVLIIAVATTIISGSVAAPVMDQDIGVQVEGSGNDRGYQDESIMAFEASEASDQCPIL